MIGFVAMKRPKSNGRRSPAFPILFPFTIFLLLLQITTLLAYCQPGCQCVDDAEAPSASCRHSSLATVPILLNPMLRRLQIRGSNALKLDPFAIGIYQRKFLFN